MTRRAEDVTAAELTLLNALWEAGPATIRALAERVYGATGSSTYATVQKLLERLEEKGFVSRDRSGPAHRFAAAIAREDLIDRRLRALAEALCGGSLTPLLSHLVKAERLSPQERKALRRLIDQDSDRPPKP